MNVVGLKYNGWLIEKDVSGMRCLDLKMDSHINAKMTKNTKKVL